MHRKYQNRQCLICHKELNQETSLFHLLYPRSLCLDCLSKFEVVSQKTHLLGYSTYVLYKYNDFFRTTLYQYKALDDYASQSILIGQNDSNAIHLNKGKAYLQKLYDDLARR